MSAFTTCALSGGVFFCLRPLNWSKEERVKEFSTNLMKKITLYVSILTFYLWTASRRCATRRLFYTRAVTLGRMCSFLNFMTSCDVRGAVMNPWCLPVEISRQESKNVFKNWAPDGSSRVRLWCHGCRWRRRRGGAYRGVLVARAVTDIWRQRIRIQRRVPPWSHVGSAGWTGWRGVAGLGPEDESGLVLLLKVGDVFHHGFTVGDWQLVGAVCDQVEVVGDEDDGKRKHGHNYKSEAHDQSPGRVALEALLGLKGRRWTILIHWQRSNKHFCSSYIKIFESKVKYSLKEASTPWF